MFREPRAFGNRRDYLCATSSSHLLTKENRRAPLEARRSRNTPFFSTQITTDRHDANPIHGSSSVPSPTVSTGHLPLSAAHAARFGGGRRREAAAGGGTS